MLAFIVKTETDDRIRMNFLLHKDKKENGNPPHIQAHLSLPDTKANASQSQKSLHFATPLDSENLLKTFQII
jgi:hypothetical protein